MAWRCLLATMPNGQAYGDCVDYFEWTWLNGNFSLSKWNVHLRVCYRVATCDVTGGMASLNFDTTELQIFFRESWKPK